MSDTISVVKSDYESLEDFYVKNWLKPAFHPAKLRHENYGRDKMPNWRWRFDRPNRHWITMVGGVKLTVSCRKNVWKYEPARYPLEDGFKTQKEVMDNACYDYGALHAPDELRRLKLKLSGSPCPHENRYPDLLDWVERCADCESTLRYIGKNEGNEFFGRITGLNPGGI